MLEISPQTRLVRHHSGESARWQLQHRTHHSGFTRRDIWCPVDRLMDEEQALAWLSRQPAAADLVNQFLAAQR